MGKQFANLMLVEADIGYDDYGDDYGPEDYGPEEFNNREAEVFNKPNPM